MTHLTPGELVDAADRTLAADRARHLEGCPRCRAEVDELAGILREAASVPVPEPSPLFWTHFSQRVHDAIAAEATQHATRASSWLRWPVLAPMTALALAVFALVSTLARGDITAAPRDEQWAQLAEVVGPIDLETVQAAGLVEIGDVERAVLELSLAEQRELLRLMEEEISRAGGL
jgi:hypothetical protein